MTCTHPLPELVATLALNQPDYSTVHRGLWWCSLCGALGRGKDEIMPDEWTLPGRLTSEPSTTRAKAATHKSKVAKGTRDAREKQLLRSILGKKR